MLVFPNFILKTTALRSLFLHVGHPEMIGSLRCQLKQAKKTLEYLSEKKHWICLKNSYLSAAIAANLLSSGKIVAIPTDTIYGLAGLAESDQVINKLYDVKGRDTSKPFAICLGAIEDIENWAHTEQLPCGLIEALLPGGITLILRRKKSLYSFFNPGVENVGIRIPNDAFVLNVMKLLRKPVALTSANKSNERSTLHPYEFEDLWPQIDGIFYDKINIIKDKPNFMRRGSTIVDLSVENEFKIIRAGSNCSSIVAILKHFKLTEHPKE